MTEICLLRHGETEWNKQRRIQGLTDNSLNEEGIHQANLLGDYLNKHDNQWDIIVTSPLKRALETAKIVSEKLGYSKDILIDPRCIERTFGELEGAPLNSDTYDRIFSENVVGMELVNDLINRSTNTLKALGKAYPNQRILIATHSQFIKSAITSLDPTFNFRSWLHNASLNYFTVEEDTLSLKSYNITV